MISLNYVRVVESYSTYTVTANFSILKKVINVYAAAFEFIVIFSICRLILKHS